MLNYLNLQEKYEMLHKAYHKQSVLISEIETIAIKNKYKPVQTKIEAYYNEHEFERFFKSAEALLNVE